MQKNVRLFVICLLVFSGIGVSFGLPKPAQTQNGGHEHLAMIDYLPPASSRLAVQGSIAVLAAGPALLVYDVGDPDSPAQLAERVFSQKIIDVQVGARFAYVLGQDNVLTVIDLIDPRSPVEVGIYRSPYPASTLAVQGDQAYIGSQAGLEIIDISHPGGLVLQGFLATPRRIANVALNGRYAYLNLCNDPYGHEYGLIWTVDVHDPIQPILVDEFDQIIGSLRGGVTDGQRLVVSTLWSGEWWEQPRVYVIVFTLQDAAHPLKELEKVYENFSDPVGLEVDQDAVFVGFAGTIQAYRVDGLGNLIELDDVCGRGRRDLELQDGLLYSAAEDRLLMILDVHDLVSLQTRSILSGMGAMRDVVSGMERLLIADGGLDISQGTNYAGGLVVTSEAQSSPIQIASRLSWNSAANVASQGQIAYITDGYCIYQYKAPPNCYHYLNIVNLADPDNPEDISRMDINPVGIPNHTVAYSGPIAVKWGILLIADYEFGLLVIDASDPYSPQWLATYDPNIRALGVAWHPGNNWIAYVSNEYGNMKVVDFRDLLNPVELAEVPGVNTTELTALGDVLYAAAAGSGVYILDISQPEQPQIFSQVDTPGWAYEATADGSRLYVADGTAGLSVIDIASLAAPMLLYTLDTSGSAEAVEVAGDRLVLADGEGGLIVYRQTPAQVYLPLVACG